MKIGYVPLIDCAPLVLAHEFGFFREEGLEVELVREPGWATIRDKVAYGELDAAHALAGLCFALSWGLGVLPRACLTGFLLNAHGDAITISSKLVAAGVCDAASLAQWIRRTAPSRRPTFAVPHPFSSHHFLMRHFLKPEGVLPERDYELITLPPSQMAGCLASEYIDGFCVGEPFNTEAVTKGVGSMLTTSVDLVPGHPEKALLISKDYADRQPDAHRALILGLAKACALCESKNESSVIADVLSRPVYLGMEPALLRESLESTRPEFHLFHGVSVNRPSSEKANWLVTQMRLAGLLLEKDGAAETRTSVTEIFRADLYDEIAPEFETASP